MNDDTIKFIIELRFIENGILPDRINADKQITRKNIVLAIIESDNVGEIVVSQIFKVDIQYIVVRTENDIDVSNTFHLTACYGFEPGIIEPFVLEIKRYAFGKISDH